MTTLATILEVEIRNRNKSIRQIAEEVGVAHTTLNRALKGEQVGVETLLKVAEWMGVQPSVLINAEGKNEDALIYQVALILKSEPRLAQVLQEAMSRVASGEMSPAIFKDLAAYAAYRLSTEAKGEPDKEHELNGKGLAK